MNIQHRNPLKELPLEHFLPPNPNIPPASVKPIKRNKRPPSPSGPTPFSPAKRRILNDEGVYSPEKTCKSPLPSITARLASPARFAHVLEGPGSPARVLDFGLPKNVDGDPQKRASLNKSHTETNSTTPTQRLAPSPELKAKSTQPVRKLRSVDVFQNEDSEYEDDSNPLRSAPAITPIFILRERPPPPNPLSVHYPGFSVYQDPHVVIFPNVGRQPSVEPGTHKENLPPRRMAKVAPAPGATGCVLDSGAMPPMTSGFKTPQKMEMCRSEELFSTISRNKLRISSPSNGTKKSRRQVMKDEMDVPEDYSPSDE